MDFKNNFKSLVFGVLFVLISLLGMNINFSGLVGAQNQFFTLFQFWGPVAGGFLGALFGSITVLVAQFANLLIFGKTLDFLTLLRLLPMLFAAYYFSRNKISNDWKSDYLSIAVPVVAILIFLSNPAGAGAWYFSLFWLIPIAVKFLPDHLLLRSLGSTFTAHAVGGAIWVLTIPMTSAAWSALVPVVIYERLMFTMGIALSYIVFTNILNVLDKSLNLGISKTLNLEKRYLL